MVQIKLLAHGDEQILDHVAEGVFDNSVNRDLTAQYLGNPHNHVAVGIEDGVVVGFASGIDYVHPDKLVEMWINEVGVAPTHQRRGIGKAVLAALIDAARDIGCAEAWVLTGEDNASARGLYRDAGGIEQSSVMVTFPVAPVDVVSSA